MRKILFIAMCIFSGGSILATPAQPVPVPEDQSTSPQVQLSAVGIGTLGYTKNAERVGGEGTVNFSDSAILIGAAQRLYGGGIGSLGVGGVTTEETNKGVGTSLFLHQAFLDFQTQSFEVLVGRSDNPSSHLVDFPTLRGDDLITLLNPLNPFSDGKNVEEHRYSNVASVTLNQGLTYFENIHVQHLVNSSGVGTENGINSAGITFEYLCPPGMEALDRVPSVGFGYEYLVKAQNDNRALHQFYAGGVVNLSESITHRLDFRVQDILGFGSDLSALSNLTDSYRANSNTIAFSLRYLNTPFGGAGYQIALTGGYKKYFSISESDAFGGAITAIKRLGQGFDAVFQYQGQWRGSQLALHQSAGLSFEQIFEVGLVFSFDTVFNQHLSPRRSLLNFRHSYIPE